MPWILAAREEPLSLEDHFVERHGNYISREILDEAAAAYDPAWLTAAVIETDGTGSAHSTGRYQDAPGVVLAARTQDSADAVDPGTGEPLRELWLEVEGFGDDLADAIGRGRDARSVGLSLMQSRPDGEVGPYLIHLAILTKGELPRVPGMPPLDPNLFRAGAADEGARQQIAASLDATGPLIERVLSTPEGLTMADEERDDERDEKKAAAAEEAATDEKDEDEEEEEETATASAPVDLEKMITAAVAKATGAKPKRKPAPAINAEALASAMGAAMAPVVAEIGKLRQDLDGERKARQVEAAQATAKAHATELVAALPPGLKDDAVETLAAISDKAQREKTAKLLASAAGATQPVNLDDVKVDGKAIPSRFIELAAANLGVGRNDIRGPAGEQVMQMAASLASAAADKEVN